LHVSREVPLSRGAESFKSSVGIRWFQQSWLETEPVRNQRRSEALADIQPEIPSPLLETLPLFAIPDAGEDVKVSILPGGDEDWPIAGAPHILNELADGRVVVGAVAIGGEHVGGDLDGERHPLCDGGVDVDPADSLVVRIDQQRIAAALHDREREAAAVLEELRMVAVSGPRVLRRLARTRRGG
jgi:hypothetical protein